MKQLNWGVIGCGWVARDYGIPGIIEAESARLVGVYDRNVEVYNELGLKTKHYETVDAMLADLQIEAVYIATPNHCHAEQVALAAAAGKVILCEKPMGCNAEEILAMEKAVEQAGVVYATAYDQRYHEAHELLKGWVAGQKLGRITQARIHYACWLHREWHADNWRIDRARAGGGACIDLAPHGIDLLMFLLGEEPEALNVMLQSRLQSYTVDDGAVLSMRFPSGVLASIHVGYNCPDVFPRRRLELIGEHGTAIAVNTMGQVPGGEVQLIATKEHESQVVKFEGDQSPFTRQVENFSRHVLHGDALPSTLQRDVRLSLMLRRALDAAESIYGAANAA